MATVHCITDRNNYELTSVAELSPPAAVTFTLVAADTLAVHAAPSATDRCHQHQSKPRQQTTTAPQPANQ